MTPEDTRIFNAIANNSDEQAKSLIEIAEQQDPTDANKNQFLHWSIEAQNTSVALHLLLKGYDPNIPNPCGLTPLMSAINSNNADSVKLLLAAGADIEAVDNFGTSALRLTLESSNASDDIVRQILENLRDKCGGTTRKTARRFVDELCRLDQAALLRDSLVIEGMLDLREVVPMRSLRRALEVSSKLGDVETVAVLTSRIYNNYMQPENVKLLRILLKAGMSPTECTWDGNFAMGPTLTDGHSAMVRLLLRSAIDFTARDRNSERTALHYLAINTNPGIAEVLEMHVKEFDVNAIDRYETTPLYHAVAAGNVEVLRLLLENGAEVECRHSLRKYTPLHKVYLESGSEFVERYNECAKLLLRYKANPQYVVDDGATIFDVARDERETGPIVAQLALIERIGGTISDVIGRKIDSKRSLKKYLKRCRRMLRRKVAGEVTVADLLTSCKRRLARYVFRENSLRKVKYMRYRRKLKRSYSYYYESIKSSLSRNYRCIRAREVLCELFEGRVDTSDIVVDKLMEFLDEKSVGNLYEVSKSGGLLVREEGEQV